MGKLSAIRFFKSQWTNLELASVDLTGKTVIITGANIGLGFEAAKHLARMKPAKLILACRDRKRATEAVERIRADTKIGDELVAWDLDLSKFSSVRAFVDQFEKEGGGRLDLLIENAAVNTTKFQKTEDLWEQTFQVNYLSAALLAILLLPIQIKTASSGPTPRLLLLSSDGHYLVGPREEKLNPKVLEKFNDENYRVTPLTRYNMSKLMNIFLTRSLTARLPPSAPLTVVSVNPGLCHSALSRNEPGVRKLFIEMFKNLFARTSEMGSRTIIWGAVGGENEAIRGHYLDSCRIGEESDWVLSKQGKEMQDNAWETIDVLKEVDPRVDSIVTEYLSAQ